MLHATFAGGKSNRYRAYQGYRDDLAPRVHEEDEITSIVLGPLDFLPAASVQTFWLTVFEICGLGEQDLIPQAPPNRSTVKFWDSRLADQGGVRIEPDGRVDLFWDNSGDVAIRKILLIEVKWRAQLSGTNQLHRQWQDYLTDDERPHAVHLFIGIETSAGLEAKSSPLGDVWNGKLVLITWREIRAALALLALRADALGRWALRADHFLKKVGIRRFLGFSDLSVGTVVAPVEHHSIFWNKFSTWAWLNLTRPIVSNPEADEVFFKRQ